MSKILRAFVLLAFVAACGGGHYSVPRNLDNACSILKQRPTYLKAMQRTERKWGIPLHVQMATIHQESKFLGNARTPYQFVLGVIPMGRQSSAYGYSQALDGTWDDYRKETNSWGARRDDIDDATDFIGWYMAQSVEDLGISPTDATNQYLAYHEGRTGYARRSYRSKSWLVRISANVGAQSEMYQQQLATCT
ncbi:MAG: lytic transglycosylase [Marinosulfonomonas sp.]|nr:lytic transglycosylase [Marinosulfonomonas sp.]